MESEHFCDGVEDEDLRKERTRIIKVILDKGPGGGVTVPNRLKTDTDWHVLLAMAESAPPIEEANPVVMLMSVLNCGKANPKIQSILNDYRLLESLVDIARRAKPEFYELLWKLMLFIARNVFVEEGFPTGISPLMIFDQNKSYLPSFAKILRWEKTLLFIDELLAMDTKNGYSSQTLFTFLLQSLTSGRENTADEIAIAKRMGLIISLTGARLSHVRLTISQHNNHFWGARCLKKLVLGPLLAEDKVLLDLLFSLLRLETSHKGHEVRSGRSSTTADELIKVLLQEWIPDLCSLMKAAINSKVPFDFNTASAPAQKHLVHEFQSTKLATNAIAFEFQSLMLATGHFTSYASHELLLFYFLDIVESQANNFVEYLANPEQNRLVMTAIYPFGLPHFFFVETSHHFCVHVSSSPSKPIKPYLITFNSLCQALKEKIHQDPAPPLFSDILAWTFTTYEKLLKPLIKGLDSTIVNGLGTTPQLLKFMLEFFQEVGSKKTPLQVKKEEVRR